eukprot:7213959-Alexandrium_andersonii.AAC.1
MSFVSKFRCTFLLVPKCCKSSTPADPLAPASANTAAARASLIALDRKMSATFSRRRLFGDI